MDGQLTLTEYLKSKIECGQLKDFTEFLNSQGKSQYEQIGEIIRDNYDREKEDKDLLSGLTNSVSVYVLNQSIEYSNYLRKESKLS